MAKLEILVYPDERLRQVSQPVKTIDDKITSFISDLEETLKLLPGCVGIAAPQVGRFERIVIVDVSSRQQHKNHGHLVLINPVITFSEGNSIGREGCLSVPDQFAEIDRPSECEVEYLDYNSKKNILKVSGPVSYTTLPQPTICSVYISVVAES